MNRLLLYVSMLFLSTTLALSQNSLPKAKAALSDPRVEIVSLPKSIQERIAFLRLGISRARVDELLRCDGGLFYPLKPRYYVNGVTIGGKHLMMELLFQPAGMSNAIFADERLRNEWVRTHVEYSGDGADDVLRGIGTPYLSAVAID